MDASRRIIIIGITLVIATTAIAWYPTDDAGAMRTLGRALFYDPILSVDSSVSCGTCHQQFAAFAHVDHALSHGVMGRVGRRNVPPLQNMADREAYMWDGAIEQLDMQALSPLTGHEEMGERLDRVVEKLRAHSWYAAWMQRAYGSTEVTVPRVLRALGAFVRSLESRRSRYDLAMRGLGTLDEYEQRGEQLFVTYCTACHGGPDFTDDSYTSNGLPVDTMLQDVGRARVTHDASDTYHFRVPSLRNVERTSPYMHDGRFKRLKDVVLFYATPSMRAEHADARMRDMPAFDERQRKDLLAFLQTLTDESFLRDTTLGDPWIPPMR